MLSAVARAKEIWQRFRASRWYRTVELGILTTSFALMFYALAKNLSKVDLSAFQFNVGSFLIAVVLTWIAVWLGAISWAQVLQAIQPEVSQATSVRSHMLSITTKYLPGFGWQQVSKVVQLKREPMPLQITVSAAIVEFILVIFTGLATATRIFLTTRQEIFGFVIPGDFAAGFELMLWVACLVLPLCWILFQLKPFSPGMSAISYSWHMLMTIIIQIIGWLFFGAGLWFACYSIYPVDISLLPYFAMSLILSVVIGILVIVAPNGLGVRELTMSTFLQVYIPLPVGVVVSLMSRFILILAEILAVLPFILMRYLHNPKHKEN